MKIKNAPQNEPELKPKNELKLKMNKSADRKLFFFLLFAFRRVNITILIEIMNGQFI